MLLIKQWFFIDVGEQVTDYLNTNLGLLIMYAKNKVLLLLVISPLNPGRK